MDNFYLHASMNFKTIVRHYRMAALDINMLRFCGTLEQVICSQGLPELLSYMHGGCGHQYYCLTLKVVYVCVCVYIYIYIIIYRRTPFLSQTTFL